MPRKTPTYLKLLRGERRPSRINKREPKPKGDLLVAPAFLDEAQVRYWNRAIADSPPGLLRRLDAVVVTSYCIAAAGVEEATVQLAATGGPVIAGSRGRGTIENPWHRILKHRMAILLRCCAALGFDPASRGKVEVVADPTPDDEWDEILDP